MIAGLLTWLAAGRLGRLALRTAALVAAVVLLLLACRRSGERLGRTLERLEAWREAMTCSGTCWRRRHVVLAIATSLLAGCGTDSSDRPVAAACPPVASYGADLQARAAAEVGSLPAGSAVAALLSDYAVMRDQVNRLGGAEERRRLRPARRVRLSPKRRRRERSRPQDLQMVTEMA